MKLLQQQNYEMGYLLPEEQPSDSEIRSNAGIWFLVIFIVVVVLFVLFCLFFGFIKPTLSKWIDRKRPNKSKFLKSKAVKWSKIKPPLKDKPVVITLPIIIEEPTHI